MVGRFIFSSPTIITFIFSPFDFQSHATASWFILGSCPLLISWQYYLLTATSIKKIRRHRSTSQQSVRDRQAAYIFEARSLFFLITINCKECELFMLHSLCLYVNHMFWQYSWLPSSVCGISIYKIFYTQLKNSKST